MNGRHRIPAWIIAMIGAALGTVAGAIIGGFAGAFVGENILHTEGLDALGPVLGGMALGALVVSIAGAFIALNVAGRPSIGVALLVGAGAPVAVVPIVSWWPASLAGIVALIVFGATSIARRWNAPPTA